MTIHPPFTTIDGCRSCGHSALKTLVAFGDTPIADRLVRPDDLEPEYVAPLTLMTCPECSLCQIAETVTPRILFGPDYPYFSSVSPALLKHFRDSATDIIHSRSMGKGDLVIEAASNDGYMLSVFDEHGIGVLGIDPADGPVAVAKERGIDMVHDFLTAELARSLAAQGKQADVFLANNVLAHVADTNDFVEAISILLKDDGLVVIECPYLLDMIDNRAFDTIYHQHLLFLSLTALKPLFARHSLFLNDFEHVAVHGGTVRLFISKSSGESAKLKEALKREADRNVGQVTFYKAFLDDISEARDKTRAAITAFRAQGKRILGYGAAAKATTLLHYFGLDKDDIPMIVDKSAAKHGLLMPVVGIPIGPIDQFDRSSADIAIVLAWNFANEIVAENESFLKDGGIMMVPVPEFREVSDQSLGVSL